MKGKYTVKKYKAIFFDWDGTAVLSRKAPVDDIVGPMKALLAEGVKLAVISGTTMENIGGGKLYTYFTPKERENLFFGLGRGAFNYAFNKGGEPYTFGEMLPDRAMLVRIHDVCYAIHKYLLKEHGLNTDIVFSRPNYCKIDLMVENNRGEALFLQEGETERLLAALDAHGFEGGLKGLVGLAEGIGREMGIPVLATTDAKYLEVGISSKSDNVNTILGFMETNYGISAVDCSFWGDEYIGFGEGIFGSDSFMITAKTRAGDFFDVSETPGARPGEVTQLGGGVKRFEEFLISQRN